MLRLQNAILSPPVGSRKFCVQSVFKCFHRGRRYRGLRKTPVVTLTCASWGSAENIISGVRKGSLPFCSSISGIITTPEAAESSWMECYGHLDTRESNKKQLKSSVLCKSKHRLQVPCQVKIQPGLWPCLFVDIVWSRQERKMGRGNGLLVSQLETTKFFSFGSSLILMYVSEPTDVSCLNSQSHC